MTAWSRRFVLAGLALIAAGFVFGLLFSLSVNHQARLVAYDAYQPVFEAIARGGASARWQPLEQAISNRSVAQRRAMDVHGHSINMGVLLILTGLLIPVVGERRDRRALLLPVLVASAFVYPLGLLLQYCRLTTAGEIVAALGALGAIAAFAGLLLQIARSVDSAPPSSPPVPGERDR